MNGAQIQQAYDSMNRLANISSAPVVGDPLSYAYQYDAAGQREQVTLANNDTWVYGYNSRGEVISGSKKQGGTTDLLGYQFGYAFDNIGNRTSASREGRVSNYTANSLNQYTQRTVPGYINVIGSAKPTATVTVNDESTTRQGDAFYKELSVDNTSQPVYQATNVKAVLGTDTAEINGNVFVPKTAEAFTHDEDGNLLADGRWVYRWNGENRLVQMETQLEAANAGTPKQRLTFTYDHQRRRISKKVEDWKATHYQERFTMLFLYDGWNLVAEVLTTGPKIRTYVWGSDLSGGNAAGGIGGASFCQSISRGEDLHAGL